MSDSEQPRRRPLIGICAASERVAWSFWHQQAAVVAGSYLDAVRRAGGQPLVLVPEPVDQGQVEPHGAWLDGLLLIGGADIHPAGYGQSVARETEATYPLRDGFEIALVRAAFAWDLPVLGICRGLQILNVATGGTLHQHLADAGFGEHRPLPGSLGEATHHEVEIEPGTALAARGARRLTVNSHHHQGVDRVGEGGVVAARSRPDGLVEAIEWPAQRHALGVQWHPEALELDTTIGDLVAAAADRAAAVRPLEAVR
ncbi:gamma-glutamyl-gamma-aminobutyrate hydrolase family protein [Patulibacter defluvii]|uniref:gamma-glutamyl-gamma-aminobutyrate hydrolase family protein n=1 Tax=Patulibacter defluvii TaxID=3095358 RepID=UPI002A7616F8|nr:gamma-glutamyl-gamma-aminobutyrate hydrolase family protein [Patulibacter sp. DM4]